MEQSKNNFDQRPSGLEIKEGEPKVHTVYASVKPSQQAGAFSRVDRVSYLYTEEKIQELPAEDRDRLIPLKVYERLEDLPEEVQGHIRPDTGEARAEQPLEKQDGVIYAVLPNTDITEGKGESFIWVMVTDPLLAHKISFGNGVNGGDAQVMAFPVNTSLIETSFVHFANLRVGKDKKFTKGLFE